MEPIENYIVGQCMDMCPREEIEMREEQKLLHILEVLPGTEKNQFPKADVNRMVKAFCRSAAGKMTQDPKNLRPPNVLLKTVNYLLDDVICRKDVCWELLYDFIMDRLRSVRQDMVIQNISSAYFISLLQPIIRFYVYAGYRSCEKSNHNYDPHINSTHLQECLKRLLYMYNYYDQLNEVVSGSTSDTCDEFLSECRPSFEALYVIFNLGNPVAITRVLNIPNKWRTDIVKTALELSFCYKSNNFVRACRIIKLLPTLLMMTACIHLPELRRNAFKVMSTAYNSKNLTVPIKILRKLLLYDEDSQLIADCKYYGLEIRDGGVFFSKNSFNVNKPTISPTHHKFINTKLMDLNISTLLLFGD